MKKLLFLLAPCFFSFSTWAQVDYINMPQPQAPVLDADAYLVQDAYSGRILAGENVDTPMEPASLTKMMTVYVLDVELERGTVNLDDNVLISENAWQTEGSRMFVDVNTHVSVDDLRHGVIIQSGNDASVAIAEHIAGTESAFADLMNYHAQMLGMENTRFANSTGLPNPELYTTARDMAILAQAMINQFPESYALYQEKEFTYNDIQQNNRNRLLWRDNSVDGIKTGHTASAGHCLVASSVRDDMRLITVVLGAGSDSQRTAQTQELLNYGFRFFKTQQLTQANQVVSEAKIWKGRKDHVTIGFNDDVFVTIPSNQTENITSVLNLNPTLVAPIEANEPVGVLRVSIDDEVLIEEPVVALETVEKGNIFSRFIDSIKLLFHRVLSSGKEFVVESFEIN